MCRCRIRGTASSCCSVWGPGPMATFTRCAVRGGGTGGSAGGGCICTSRRGSPGPAPSSPCFLQCAPQARDTVTSELAAVKIVKLDPGVGPGGASALQGGRRGRVSWRAGGGELTFPRPPERPTAGETKLSPVWPGEKHFASSLHIGAESGLSLCAPPIMPCAPQGTTSALFSRKLPSFVNAATPMSWPTLAATSGEVVYPHTPDRARVPCCVPIPALCLPRNDRLWICMEFCGGGSLQEIYHGENQAPWDMAFPYPNIGGHPPG